MVEYQLTEKHDPDKYAEMSVPFATMEDAQTAMTEFCKEVAQLRERYRIAEVIVNVGVYLPGETEDTRQMVGTLFTLGSEIRQFAMIEESRHKMALSIARRASDIKPPK